MKKIYLICMVVLLLVLNNGCVTGHRAIPEKASDKGTIETISSNATKTKVEFETIEKAASKLPVESPEKPVILSASKIGLSSLSEIEKRVPELKDLSESKNSLSKQVDKLEDDKLSGLYSMANKGFYLAGLIFLAGIGFLFTNSREISIYCFMSSLIITSACIAVVKIIPFVIWIVYGLIIGLIGFAAWQVYLHRGAIVAALWQPQPEGEEPSLPRQAKKLAEKEAGKSDKSAQIRR